MQRRRPIHRSLLVAACAIAIVVVGACGGDDDAAPDLPDIERGPDTPMVIPDGEPIVVGVSAALTGPVGERGQEYVNAVIAGVEAWKRANSTMIAGHEIVVVAGDDACTAPGAAVTAGHRLLRRPGLVGVIGPQCSGGVEQAIDIYAEAGIVAISGSATKTDLTINQGPDGFFFRTAYRNDLEGRLVGDFLATTIDVELVYLIDDDEPFGVDLADQAQILLEDAGVDFVRLSVPLGTVDFGEIVQAALDDGADFVGYTGFNPDAALLLRQLRDAGYTGLFGAGDGAASEGDFVQPLGEDAEGALFAGCRVPLPDDLSAIFEEVHGGAASATFSAAFADAVTVLLDAVVVVVGDQTGELTIDPKALRDAVRASHLPDAYSGSVAFDTLGDRVHEPGREFDDVLEEGFAIEDTGILRALGLVSCQVQEGRLVSVGGPDPDPVLP